MISKNNSFSFEPFEEFKKNGLLGGRISSPKFLENRWPVSFEISHCANDGQYAAN